MVAERPARAELSAGVGARLITLRARARLDLGGWKIEKEHRGMGDHVYAWLCRGDGTECVAVRGRQLRIRGGVLDHIREQFPPGVREVGRVDSEETNSVRLDLAPIDSEEVEE